MTGETDKLKGLGNQAAGAIKSAVGRIVDNKELAMEGESQVKAGAAQEAFGDEKASLKEAAELDQSPAQQKPIDQGTKGQPKNPPAKDQKGEQKKNPGQIN